jgi:uncharacterized protein Yka (UPF0111/DUF47 family)
MFGGARRDEVFYSAFRDQAQIAVAASERFGAMLDDLAGAERAAAEIRQQKDKGEAILRRAVRELHTTWITPLDRHHIHELASGLSEVVRLIDSTASRLVLFRIRDVRGEARELARDVCESCGAIRAVTERLPKLSKPHAEEVMRLAGQIHELEGRADETYRRALASLFDGSVDALTVMKWREILDNLEGATDVCRDVARLFEGIILENA